MHDRIHLRLRTQPYSSAFDHCCRCSFILSHLAFAGCFSELCSAQNYLDVEWARPFNEEADVRTVCHDFCVTHHLLNERCQLYLGGSPLDSGCKMSEVVSHLAFLCFLSRSVCVNSGVPVQVSAGVGQSKTLNFTAIFDAILAFHVWHTLKGGPYPDPRQLAASWQSQLLKQVQCTRESLGRSRATADCSRATEEAYAGLVGLKSQAVLSLPLQTGCALTDSRTKAQDILLYALEQLMVSARSISHPSESSELDSSDEIDAALKLSGPHAHTALLQGLAIALKLGGIVLCLGLSAQTRDNQLAIGCIWAAIAGLHDRLRSHASFDKFFGPLPPQRATTAARAPVTEAQDIVVASVTVSRIVLAVLKKVLRQASRHAAICCHVLLVLLTQSQMRVCHAVAAHIAQSGDSPLVLL